MIDKIKSFYSKNKQLVWLLGGVALFVLLTSSKKSTRTSKSSTGSDDDAVTSSEDSVFPLSFGSKGKKVRALQRWLNYKKTTYNLTFTNLVIDGQFGVKTLNALRSVWTAMYGYPISEMTERQYIEEELLLHEEY